MLDKRSIAGTAALAALGLAWLLLAPTQLGGRASYSVVVGSSMEPGLHRGDLVVSRTADEYAVGDVVAYRDGELGSAVLHRIVERDGDRYVLKGDNNNFIDPTRPPRADLIGKMWVRVPALGRVVEWLRAPIHAAVLAALGAFLFAGRGAGARARRRVADEARERAVRLPDARGFASSETGYTALAVLGGIAAVCAVFGLWAFATPPTRVAPWTDLYGQSGRFSYAAAAPAGAVYPDGRVRTGDTVFRRLVDRVDVRFEYRFQSAQPHRVAGTGRVRVVLVGDNGWRRTLSVSAPARFRGGRFVARESIDLRRIEALTQEVQRVTGATIGTYLVTVVPDIRLAGTVAGRGVRDRFAPPLAFRLDPVQLRLETAVIPGQATNSLVRARSGRGARVEPNSLALLGMRLDVRAVRRLSLLAGLLALAGALGLGIMRARALEGDEAAGIQARYGDLLVPVEPKRRRGRIVDVSTIDSLARLAERSERVILHESAGGVHTYLVEEDGVVFRYRPSRGQPAAEVRPLRDADPGQKPREAVSK